jgi:hypothetical protein
MRNYLKIQPITFSNLKGDFTVNAISWKVMNIEREATSAKVICNLVNYTPPTNGQNKNDFVAMYDSYIMDIPNNVLQAWGSDDSVIDNFVLTYSPKFIKA